MTCYSHGPARRPPLRRPAALDSSRPLGRPRRPAPRLPRPRLSPSHPQAVLRWTQLRRRGACSRRSSSLLSGLELTTPPSFASCSAVRIKSRRLPPPARGTSRQGPALAASPRSFRRRCVAFASSILSPCSALTSSPSTGRPHRRSALRHRPRHHLSHLPRQRELHDARRCRRQVRPVPVRHDELDDRLRRRELPRPDEVGADALGCWCVPLRLPTSGSAQRLTHPRRSQARPSRPLGPSSTSAVPSRPPPRPGTFARIVHRRSTTSTRRSHPGPTPRRSRRFVDPERARPTGSRR